MASTTVLTVLNGTSVSSGVLSIEHETFVGCYTPASMEALTLTVQVSDDNATWVSINNDGSTYTITLAASQYFPIDPVLTLGARYVKLSLSGNVGADRAFKCRAVAV